MGTWPTHKQMSLKWQAFPALPGAPFSHQSHEPLNSLVHTSSPSRNQGSPAEYFLQGQARGCTWFGGSQRLPGPLLGHLWVKYWTKLDGFTRGSCPWRGRLDLRTTSRAAAAGSCRVSPRWVSLLCTKRSILCAAATKQNVKWDGKAARRTHWDWCPQFLSSQGGICTVKSCLSPQKRARIYFCQGLESFEVRREARSSMFHQCPREIATVTSQKHSNITNQTQMIMNHSLETTNGS